MPRVDPLDKAAWAASRKIESRYGVELRRLARHIADLIRSLVATPEILQAALLRYSDAIRPWADAVAARMLKQVDLRDAATWERATRDMGRAVQREIRYAPTGQVMRRLQTEQVDLITSLPQEAALRVQQQAAEAISTGERFDQRTKKIMEIGGITKNRATLIARTETAKASSILVQSRAQYIGSEGYIWRTAKDSDVRASHKKMEGKFIRWDSPPTVDEGVAPYHAGQIYNCRCYPEPVIPDQFD
jgi:SPP1 gp7 family putative phage head morphogenesis protein